MSRKEKLLQKVLEGDSKTVRFDELRKAMEICGFVHERTKGSHFAMRNRETRATISIQSAEGFAKAYQVEQFRDHEKSK